jgi:hypothetical protein
MELRCREACFGVLAIDRTLQRNDPNQSFFHPGCRQSSPADRAHLTDGRAPRCGQAARGVVWPPLVATITDKARLATRSFHRPVEVLAGCADDFRHDA